MGEGCGAEKLRNGDSDATRTQRDGASSGIQEGGGARGGVQMPPPAPPTPTGQTSLPRVLTQSVRAVVTKSPAARGLLSDIYSSQVWQLDLASGEAHLLLRRCHRKGPGALRGVFPKGANPVPEVPPLVTRAPGRGPPVPPLWGLGVGAPSQA